MATLATIDELRDWANAPSVPDEILQDCLDAGEASLIADLGLRDTTDIVASIPATSIAHSEVLRRSQRALGRRNSPEGVAGIGEMGSITLPIRDPDSVTAMQQIQEILRIPFGIA
jgi:hypothetical protein